MNIPIDPQFITDTAVRLVQIDSINPFLSPEGAGEAEAARFTAETLARLGLVVDSYEIAPGRWNVIGRLPGRATAVPCSSTPTWIPSAWPGWLSLFRGQ
jgi:acetylornithine deacetylase/succinyl-diaminopimelate desuccinylase-like protein